MSTLILIRHGETDWHVENRYVGTTDVPLNQRGMEQTAKLVERLKGEQIDCVYTSPLRRCSYMADLIAESHGLKPVVSGDIIEIDISRWDGRTYKEIIESDGEMLSGWIKDPLNTTIPGGESLSRVRDRTMRCVEEIHQNYPDGTAVIVSHGGPLRAILATVLEMELSLCFRLTTDLASISIIDYKGEFSNMKLLNDTCYLRD